VTSRFCSVSSDTCLQLRLLFMPKSSQNWSTMDRYLKNMRTNFRKQLRKISVKYDIVYPFTVVNVQPPFSHFLFIYYSLFIIYYSLFIIRYSLFIIHYSLYIRSCYHYRSYFCLRFILFIPYECERKTIIMELFLNQCSSSNLGFYVNRCQFFTIQP